MKNSTFSLLSVFDLGSFNRPDQEMSYFYCEIGQEVTSKFSSVVFNYTAKPQTPNVQLWLNVFPADAKSDSVGWWLCPQGGGEGENWQNPVSWLFAVNLTLAESARLWEYMRLQAISREMRELFFASFSWHQQLIDSSLHMYVKVKFTTEDISAFIASIELKFFVKLELNADIPLVLTHSILNAKQFF